MEQSAWWGWRSPGWVATPQRFFALPSEQRGRTAEGEMAVSTALLPLVPAPEHCCGDGHLQVASPINYSKPTSNAT